MLQHHHPAPATAEPDGTPDGAPATDPSAPRQGNKAPHAALLVARTQLEAALSEHVDWRALQQLQAREDAGEWFDVIEGDVLRDRLTVSLAAQPTFIAWQFVDAAIACLDVGALSAVVEEASLALPCADEITASRTTEFLPATPDYADPMQLQPIADAVPVPDAPKSGWGLATRIPTLQPHESRDGTTRTAPMPGSQRLASPPHSPSNRIWFEPDDGKPRNLRTSFAPDASSTLFQSKAVGIDEADVQIVVRQPQTPLIQTRLPPLPFAERPIDRGGLLPRASRASAVKWADANADKPSDFRPIGSALDEAQVSIIVTAAKSEAQSRAERRALGVAPDREKHMHRFLTALSGK